MKTVYCVKELYDGTENGIKTDCAICVEDGRITEIGPSDALTAGAGEHNVNRFDHHIMLPSFINAHDHGRAVSPAAFGAADGPLELWIPQLSKISLPIAEAAFFSGLQLAATGVGTVMHCHNCADASNAEQELIETVAGYNRAGIRVALCAPYIDQNSAIYHGRDAFIESLPTPLRQEFTARISDSICSLSAYFSMIERLEKTLEREIARGMASIQLHPVGAQWCSDEALTAMKEFARQHGMRIHMHLLETKYQQVYAAKCFRKSMVEHLNDIGFLGPWLSCAHTVWLDQKDMELLSQTGTACVLNHSSNLRLRSGQPKLQALLEKGCVCGIGLDGCGLDDDQDYFREMRVAYLNPTVSGVGCKVTPMDILRMALRNGAFISGGKLSPSCLRPGAKADFVVLDLDKMRFPYHSGEEDSLSTLLRCGTKEHISAAYVNGVCVAKDGVTQMADMREAAEELSEGIRALRRRQAPGTGISPALLERIKDFYAAWEAEL